MKPRKPPGTKHDLFPDTWVIGTAAAALARNDEGVLLADDPDRVIEAAPATQAAPVTPLHETVESAGVEPRRSLEEELAELRAENERLRRCIAGSRGDLDAVNWHVDDVAADQDLWLTSPPPLYLDGEPHRLHGRSGPRHGGLGAHRVLIGGVLVLAFGVSVAAWFAGQRLTTMEGPMAERVATLRADIAVAVGGLGERAVAWVRPMDGDRRAAPTAPVTPTQE